MIMVDPAFFTTIAFAYFAVVLAFRPWIEYLIDPIYDFRNERDQRAGLVVTTAFAWTALQGGFALFAISSDRPPLVWHDIIFYLGAIAQVVLWSRVFGDRFLSQKDEFSF